MNTLLTAKNMQQPATSKLSRSPITAARLKKPKNLITSPFVPPIKYLRANGPNVSACADREQQHDNEAPEVKKRGLVISPLNLTGIVNHPMCD